MRNGYRAGLAVSAAAAGVLMVTGTAGATPPGSGVTGTIIAQQTINGRDYILRDITIPAHQATGWHYHDGMLYGIVKQGTLSHFDATCKSDGVYRAGSTIIEPSGKKHVHIGRNLGDTPVVLEVLYVLPHGSPLSEDAPNPGCPFQ